MTAPGPFFQFEADFVLGLRCIPMSVRRKLDDCGVKLKLEHWHRLAESERQWLVDQPCESDRDRQAYREQLRTWTQRDWGEPAKDLPIDPQPAWLRSEIPEAVQTACHVLQVHLSPADWQALDPLQRFALIKLARPGHEHRNLYPALQEFGLADRSPESSPDI
ncbi:nitrate reductase associated protein [Synechococcus elongatus]|uniref:Nitrate reductase associated protein n=1 Tax=Synechococcus elongatus PCC 11801 TaxID=2219813 RepID=A0AAN1QNN1_SYNEL|nr:nitrate reductase associated protein [Synechococcus elongatus]AZB72528.1 nitrate reductase associated protein [Synechococcus elongatus PCC 11801]